MKRDIKFRGIRRDNGEWIYGDLNHLVDGVYISNDHGCNMAQVYPDTVGQYTGLKDKNGKEIYEDDILAHNGKNIGYVANDMRCYCFDLVCDDTAHCRCTLLLSTIKRAMLKLSAILTITRKEANMQETKITFTVRVSDDESRVIIANPTTTDLISFSVFTGIITSLVDFVNEWNKEHKQKGICQNTN